MKFWLRSIVAQVVVFTLTTSLVQGYFPTSGFASSRPALEVLFVQRAMNPRAIPYAATYSPALKHRLSHDGARLLVSIAQVQLSPVWRYGLLSAAALALAVFAPVPASFVLMGITVCAPWGHENRGSPRELPPVQAVAYIPDGSLVVYQYVFYRKIGSKDVVVLREAMHGYQLVEMNSLMQRKVWAPADRVRPATAEEVWAIREGPKIAAVATRAMPHAKTETDRAILTTLQQFALAGRSITPGSLQQAIGISRMDTIRERGLAIPEIGAALRVAYRLSIHPTDVEILNAIQKKVNEGVYPLWKDVSQVVGISTQNLQKRRRANTDLDAAFQRAQKDVRSYYHTLAARAVLAFRAKLQWVTEKPAYKRTTKEQWLLLFGPAMAATASTVFVQLYLKTDVSLFLAMLRRASEGLHISNGALAEDAGISPAAISERMEKGMPLAELLGLAYHASLTPTDAAILNAIQRLRARGEKLSHIRIAREARTNRATVLRRRKQQPEIQRALGIKMSIVSKSLLRSA